MLVYTLFILVVASLLYIDYATNLKLTYKASRVNVNHLAIYLVFGIITTFAGLRYEIGYDYPKYLAGFLFDSELRKWEPFFNFFTRIVREINFGLDSQALFLFFSVTTVTILIIATKRLTPYYRTSLLLYLLIPGLFLNSFSVIRQGMAIVILMYGLYYLTVQVDKKRYLAIALVAFLFHYASIFVVIAYMLGGRFFNRTYSWITYSIGIVISFLLYFAHVGKYILLILPGKFSSYASWEINVSILKLLIVNLFFIFIVLQKKQFVKTRLHRYLFNSMFLALIIFNVFADFVYVTRIAQYFLVGEIILIPIYLNSFSSKVKRQIISLLFLTYYLFNFEYALYRDQHAVGNREYFLIPYKNYLFEDIQSDKQKYQQQWIEYWHAIGVLK